MTDTTTWLLDGPPWVEYRTRRDLLDQPEDSPEVKAARQAMIDHPQIASLVEELADWPGPVLKRHNDASHLLHKLVFVADLGMRAGDPGIDPVIDRIFDHQSAEGPFQVLSNIPTHFGGTGEDQWLWMLCDAPLIVYALAKLGVDQGRFQAAVDYMMGLIRDNGWPCVADPALGGKFKGPGSKSMPCPYANLIMLRALATLPDGYDTDATRTGAETLLSLWEQRKESRPFLFAMGTHFSRLKAPLIWYDILHVLDVLTRFDWLRQDPRLCEMVDIVQSKADVQGQFTAESVWTAWKDWDFGQKRTPSYWLTFVSQTILKRASS
jgi:hypothetical protein